MRSKVNLSIDGEIVEEARDLGLNMSRIAEAAIQTALKAERNRRWVEENREALERYAEEIERDGLALDDLRMF